MKLSALGNEMGGSLVRGYRESSSTTGPLSALAVDIRDNIISKHSLMSLHCMSLNDHIFG